MRCRGSVRKSDERGGIEGSSVSNRSLLLRGLAGVRGTIGGHASPKSGRGGIEDGARYALDYLSSSFPGNSLDFCGCDLLLPEAYCRVSPSYCTTRNFLSCPYSSLKGMRCLFLLSKSSRTAYFLPSISTLWV